jgi:hypothetical protein
MSKPQTCDCTGCQTQVRRIVECLRDLQTCIGIVCDANPQLEDELIDPLDSLADRLAEIERALALAGAPPGA